MALKRILKDSLLYPFYNESKLLIFSSVVFIGNLLLILMFFSPALYTRYQFQKMILPYSNILNLISIISLIFVLGYGISIFNSSNKLYYDLPNFRLKNDFINGLKHISIMLFYFMIPFLIYFSFSLMLGDSVYDINLVFHQFGKESIFNQTQSSLILIIKSTIPNSYDFAKIVFCILMFFVFGLFECTAIYRFVKYEDFSEAFNLTFVLGDVYKSGLKLLKGFIILILVILAFVLIFSIINKFHGMLIVTLFGYSYLIIFYYRFLGLLYNEIFSNMII